MTNRPSQAGIRDDVGPIVLGGNVFGWTADRGNSFSALDAFVDGGGRMIDTADVYSAFVPGNVGGESEALIGEWLKARGRRDNVIIATKVGMLPGEGGQGLSPARILGAVEESLKRLNTDYIDLYYAHCDDADIGLEDVLETFDRLKNSGKVRAIAASNFSAARLAESLAVSDRKAVARYEAFQPHYNLIERDGFEAELRQLCIVEGLAVYPYFGLAGGFLTGKYRTMADLSGRARGGMVERHMTPAGLATLDVLDAIAREHEATPAQVALAWLRMQPGVTAPIASGTTAAQVEELLGSGQIRLSDEQLAQLDRAEL
ncbi:aldo/keto reductase [Sphingomonadaceae bacterium G21617-S1]|nr:aldo/keto reductase [Sphingomonadaceae bacterium G21617-S1]